MSAAWPMRPFYAPPPFRRQTAISAALGSGQPGLGHRGCSHGLNDETVHVLRRAAGHVCTEVRTAGSVLDKNPATDEHHESGIERSPACLGDGPGKARQTVFAPECR